MQSILISAYGCEPGKGSEQGVGWHWILQLARFSKLVVLTRSNNQFAIENALPENLKNQIKFEYLDLPPILKKFKRKEKGLYLYYLFWQWAAYRKALHLLKSFHFDYTIALTFGSIWLPTFMHRLPIPFIWGPIGGGEAVPLNLIPNLPWHSQIPQYMRYALMSTIKLNPLATNPMRAARRILVRTNDTAKLIPKQYANKVEIMLETAISNEIFDALSEKKKQETHKLRVFYSGRLVALKNVTSALQALSNIITLGIHAELTLAGDGPERKRLEAMTTSLGISEYVHFMGSITQSQVMTELIHSDVYFFPSLKEGGVWSLMEAMSVGLPVICVNTSGMSVITDDSSAIRVEPISQEHMIKEFTKALIELAHSPERRQELGLSARQRIEKHFRWEHKGNRMQEILSELESTK